MTSAIYNLYGLLPPEYDNYIEQAHNDATHSAGTTVSS